MTRRPRQNHSPAFKANVAVAAIKDERTLIELAQDFDVHPNQLKQWRYQLLEGATGVSGDGMETEPVPAVDVKTLHAKIGELALKTIFCSARDALRGERHRFERTAQGSDAERKKMIDPSRKVAMDIQQR